MVFLLGAGLMLGTSAERGLGLIYAGRVLAGIGVGAASNLSPIYCSEIAPPAIRGRLVGLYEMSWQIGGLVGFWINYGVAETMAPGRTQWIIPFAIQLVPAGMLAAGAFVIKESPRWLFSRGKREQAIKNLCWIRQLPEDHIYMQEEIEAIEHALEVQKNTVGLGFWEPFKAVINNRRVTYRFLLGGSLFLWQNATGINVSFESLSYIDPRTDETLGYQLLLAYRLQIDRYHRDEHFSPHHRCIRRRQNGYHSPLALLPHRPPWPEEAAYVRRNRRLCLHVVYWRLHRSQ